MHFDNFFPRHIKLRATKPRPKAGGERRNDRNSPYIPLQKCKDKLCCILGVPANHQTVITTTSAMEPPRQKFLYDPNNPMMPIRMPVVGDAAAGRVEPGGYHAAMGPRGPLLTGRGGVATHAPAPLRFPISVPRYVSSTPKCRKVAIQSRFTL